MQCFVTLQMIISVMNCSDECLQLCSSVTSYSFTVLLQQTSVDLHLSCLTFPLLATVEVLLALALFPRALFDKLTTPKTAYRVKEMLVMVGLLRFTAGLKGMRSNTVCMDS